jgi:hypothetical protein
MIPKCRHTGESRYPDDIDLDRAALLDSGLRRSDEVFSIAG